MDIKKIASDKKYSPYLSEKKKVKSFDYYLMNQHYSNYYRVDIYSLFNHYSYLRRRQ